MSQGRQQLSGARVSIDDTVFLSVDAAVDRVQDPISFPARGALQEGRGEEALPGGQEFDIDRVVHSPRHDGFDPGGARPAPEDMGGAGYQGFPGGPGVGLFGEGSLAPVDPAVQPEVGAMQVIGATGQGALEPFFTPVTDPVPIGVGQFPDAGGS